MASLFDNASAGTLRRLADAFRSGQLGAGLSAFSINKITPCSSGIVADLLRLSAEGMSPAHLALLLDASTAAADAGAGRLSAELVWTGPEAAGSQSRDTSVVEWAQQRNVEAGVLIRNRHFAAQLRQQFESLAQSKQVRRLTGF